MTITLNADYDVTLSTALLGYVGETNARPVSVEGMEIDGADRYVLTIDYGDGVQYEVDITGGQWTPTADILRSAQTVSCQICAKKLSGQEYILVKKSRIFRLRIGAAIGNNAVPSPDVTMDALDRIDAISRHTHADMQTAVTAAETATTAAENAKKSATAAEKSADTAVQAASRAETAKAAAETSATQADTARQGAETARAEAVTSQNNAKISAAQASASAQQTTADKNITAGYAKTAKTCADSTMADRQAVQDMATQVKADKATVAENATKVAEDRTAAETAAQAAQAIADSLPEDYVTAVGKIAENTADIGRVKLTDKELQRRVNALYDMGNGITHKFETDTDTAYAKIVPTGAKLMSVKNVGGRSIVWNQLCDTVLDNFSDTVSAAYHEYGICKFTANVGDKICVYSGGVNGTYAANGAYVAGFMGSAYFEFFGKQIVQCTENGNCIIYLRLRGNGNTYSNVSVRPEFFNLTKMFGAGNEPTSVEEFESMFPNGYYPYNEGELMSMSVNNVENVGKNLFDCYGFSSSAILDINAERRLTNSYGTTISTIEPSNKLIVTQSQATGDSISHVNNGWFCIGVKGMKSSKNYVLSFDFTVTKALRDKSGLLYLINGRYPQALIEVNEINVKKRIAMPFEYMALDDRQYIEIRLCGLSGIFENFQIEEGSSMTAYSPYKKETYAVPQSILNLEGYGWSSGTARNYVDYENKKYYQCVQSVNLGTLTWARDNSANRWYNGNLPRFLSDKNAMCSQLSYIDNADNLQNGQWGHSGSSYFEVYVADATTSADVAKKMSGVILYYKLATPIITDISTLIDDDFLRNIEVEAGGTITFKNSNGDSYRIPVPSEEEYIVKLSEVGGTT